MEKATRQSVWTYQVILPAENSGFKDPISSKISFPTSFVILLHCNLGLPFTPSPPPFLASNRTGLAGGFSQSLSATYCIGPTTSPLLLTHPAQSRTPAVRRVSQIGVWQCPTFARVIHTIIGAGSFHGPVRDGKAWDQTAMAAKLKLYKSSSHRSCHSG